MEEIKYKFQKTRNKYFKILTNYLYFFIKSEPIIPGFIIKKVEEIDKLYEHSNHFYSDSIKIQNVRIISYYNDYYQIYNNKIEELIRIL